MGTFGADHIAVGIVLVVVVMGVNRDLRRHLCANHITKQRKVGRVVSDLFRVAMAAHMLVEANDRIGRRHH